MSRSNPRIPGLCGALLTAWLAGCASPKPVIQETPPPAPSHPIPAAPPPVAEAEPGGEKGQPPLPEENCIYFTLRSSTISAKERPKLDAVAEQLLEDRKQVVTLIGHANDNGSPSFNLAVSDSRVAAVAEQLRKRGVARAQIRREALGSERIPKNCRSNECRQKSRKVELILSKVR